MNAFPDWSATIAGTALLPVRSACYVCYVRPLCGELVGGAGDGL